MTLFFSTFLEKEQSDMNMKKMIFFALAGVMSLGLAACSGENVKTTSGGQYPACQQPDRQWTAEQGEA